MQAAVVPPAARPPNPACVPGAGQRCEHALVAPTLNGRLYAYERLVRGRFEANGHAYEGQYRRARTGRDGRYTIAFPGGDGDYMVQFQALGSGGIGKFLKQKLTGDDVREGRYPAPRHTYAMADGEWKRFAAALTEPPPWTP